MTCDLVTEGHLLEIPSGAVGFPLVELTLVLLVVLMTADDCVGTKDF